jgi:hypothetical protein
MGQLSIVCESRVAAGRAGGVLKFTRLDESETHATTGRPSGEGFWVFGFNYAGPERSSKRVFE